MKKIYSLLVIGLILASFSNSYATSYPFISPSVSLGNNTGCAITNYTFTQTTGGANNERIDTTDIVTITFPAGVNLTSVTRIGSTFKGIQIDAFGWSVVGQTITFNVPNSAGNANGIAVGKNKTFSIVIANVTNGNNISSNCSVSATNVSGGTDSANTYAFTNTVCPPVLGNDNCASPTVLTPAPALSGVCTSINGSTFGATASPQAVCGGQADDDVWYTFTANNTTHQVTVDGDANFNAYIEVFSGTCAGTLTSIACINTTGLNGVETASLNSLSIGNTYYVRVYHNGTGFGSTAANAFTICVTSSVPPCALGTGSVSVPSLPYTTSSTTCGAVNDITSSNSAVCGSSLYYGGEDMVYSFTPTSSGNVSINVTSAGSYMGITLYQGCPTTGGTCVAFSQSSAGNQSIGCAAVTSGVTYYLVIDSWPTPTCNAFGVTISAPTGGIPAGTTCSNAVSMTFPYNAIGESTLCYGNDYTNASAGSCGTLYESGEDKVYTFTTTGADCIGIELSNASTDFIGYQVYQGCPGVGGTLCISNGGGATSGVLSGSFTVPSAGTYYLVVDTYASPSYVNYDIQVFSQGGAPSNDLPCNAQNLGTPSATAVSATGDNNCSGGTSEPAAPGGWTGGNLNTVWYAFTVPASGSFIVRTVVGSLANTQIAAYYGTCSSLTLISANNDMASCGGTSNYASELTIGPNALYPAGSTVYVRVDGANNATGNFTIMAVSSGNSFPGVQGQDCSQPNPVCQANMSVSNPGYSGNGNNCDLPTTYCLASGERNITWYRIPISVAGNLAFNIVPNDFVSATESETDYDFAIFKTAESGGTLGTDFFNCAQIQAGTATPEACNYSYLGVTGIGAGGNAPNSLSGTVCPQCGGGYNPSATYGGAYETQLSTSVGDEYLLAISNFSNSTSGFKIEFLTGAGYCTIDYAAATATNEVYWSGGDAINPNEVNDVDNWGGCQMPSCSVDAIVSAVSNEPIVYSGQTRNVKNITIQPGANITLLANSILEICGDLINYGTINADPTSTIRFVGSANQNMSGAFTGTSILGNLVITKTGGYVIANNNVEMAGSFTTSNATSIFNSNNRNISVGGNFTNNNGDATFSNTGTTGTLEFMGSAVQNYNQGSSQLNLNFVLMNNTAAVGSGVNLLTNMFIKSATGTLTLNSGTITTSAFRVDVANIAPTAVTAGNTTSFVDGNLRRYLTGSGAYNWPVGNVAKGYQRAFTNFTATTINYIDSRFDIWPFAAPYPIQGATECFGTYSLEAEDNGYWTLTKGNAGTANYNMTLYPLNATNTAPASGWTIMKKAPPATISGWLLDGVCAASTATVVSRTGLSNFSVFGVAQSPLPLSIELINFNGEIVGEDNLLTWTTVNESNNDFFTLERSRNGFDFEELAFIDGAGNNNGNINYAEYDLDPYAGITYYRLKQTDFDGTYTYSQTIALDRGLEEAILSELFPNPASQSVNFTIQSPKSKSLTINMYDNTGRLIAQELKDVVKGSNTYQIDINHLAKGIYTIAIQSDVFDKIEIKQFVKQ